jgi:ABC-type uncharacterized transport system substrate-binding protein
MTGAAAAHPHVFIDATYRVDMTGGDTVKAIDIAWTFDETYSSFLLEDLDKDKDGAADQPEMQKLAAETMESLAEYGWFMEMKAGEDKIGAAKPQTFAYRQDGKRLTLSFTLPLATPVDPRVKGFAFSGYDPYYYIDMVIPGQGNVAVTGTESCGAIVIEPEARQTMLGGGSWMQDVAGDRFMGAGAMFAQRVDLRC